MKKFFIFIFAILLVAVLALTCAALYITNKYGGTLVFKDISSYYGTYYSYYDGSCDTENYIKLDGTNVASLGNFSIYCAFWTDSNGESGGYTIKDGSISFDQLEYLPATSYTYIPNEFGGYLYSNAGYQFTETMAGTIENGTLTITDTANDFKLVYVRVN